MYKRQGIGYVIFFLAVYLIFCEFNESAKQRGEILVFTKSTLRKMKKEKKLKSGAAPADDVENSAGTENANDKKLLEDSFEESASSDEIGISKSEAIYHWKNLCYEVQIKDETRRILNCVDGWVKPGTLTALMGASGAGKTTLLDCLASRVTTVSYTHLDVYKRQPLTLL